MTAVADTTTIPHDEHDAEHAHPPDRTYWLIGGILAVLTAIEVTTYWWPEEWHRFTAVALIGMMIAKFALVALFFMHLKFDSKLLGRTFVFGLIMALAVYLATLSAFLFWDDSGNLDKEYPDPPRAQEVPPPVEAP